MQGMTRPKIMEPVTANEERALAENRKSASAGKHAGSPSRAHRFNKTGGGHEKKPGGSMPKKSGRTGR
jgi:hypothetical protein